MQFIGKANKGFRFLLCVFSKHARVISLSDKKGITITNAFQKIWTKSNRKPNKIWIDKASEFYKSSVKNG